MVQEKFNSKPANVVENNKVETKTEFELLLESVENGDEVNFDIFVTLTESEQAEILEKKKCKVKEEEDEEESEKESDGEDDDEDDVNESKTSFKSKSSKEKAVLSKLKSWYDTKEVTQEDRKGDVYVVRLSPSKTIMLYTKFKEDTDDSVFQFDIDTKDGKFYAYETKV